ncbi:MAG TPA: Ig-like domain-containing protein [Gemmatimonadales bacterium]|nr:Ig-like domain-containing protein [Gemmatimonadales bacterium]
MLRLCANRLTPGAVLFGILLSSCGGGGDGGTGTPPSTTVIAKASANNGDAQTGTVGQALPTPLQVVVTDAGAASVGTTVTWATRSGGTVNPTSAVTDANGAATTTWTLGTTSGSQAATATLSGASGSPVTFSATANPDAATGLSLVSGDGQTGVLNSQLAQQLQVKVADQFGNGVAGVAVAWAATGGTVSSASVQSDGSGISAVTVTVGGSAGPVTVTATADGLTGSPVTFNETAATAPPIPTTASVSVGNIFFKSGHNGLSNPATDTVAVGGTVTWTWVGGSHSVVSTGTQQFTGSGLAQSSGTYQFTFNTAGSYTYICGVHGAAMNGRVVVLTP